MTFQLRTRIWSWRFWSRKKLLTHNVHPINIDISDHEAFVVFNDTGGGAHYTVAKVNHRIQMNVTTVDNLVPDHRLLVGFVKASIEGVGYEMTSGGHGVSGRHR